jgi:SdpC family antimicrobial peptide
MISRVRRLIVRNVFATSAILAVFLFVGCGRDLLSSGGDPAAPQPDDSERTNAATAMATAIEPIASEYTGEEYFRGLILGHGPVAAKIPEIRQQRELSQLALTAEQWANIGSVNDQLVALVSEKNPGFFDSFKTEIESKDHLRIQDALHGAAAQMLEAMLATPNGPAMEELASDPAKLDAVALSLQQAHQDGQVTMEELTAAVEAGFGSGPETQLLSFSIVWVAVAVVVAWLWVAVAQDVAVVHVAAVVQVIHTVWAAWKWVVGPKRVQQAELLEEQLVNSVAGAF